MFAPKIRTISIRPTKSSVPQFQSALRLNRGSLSRRPIFNSRYFSSFAVERTSFWTLPSLLPYGLAALLGLLLFDDDEKVKAADAPSATLAQSTVVTGTHPVGAFVIIHLSPTADLRAVAKAAATLPNVIKKVSPEVDAKKPPTLLPVMAGVAFGTQKWEEICNKNKLGKPSAGFGHYNVKSGELGTMPATGGDIFLHVKAETQSLCFETVKAFLSAFPANSISRIEDEYSFQFQDGRDLSGFLDGTENPSDDVARREAALLPNGGSYVIHQRWIHNLAYLHSKKQSEQEAIIGRSKEDSAELSRRDMKPSAHVARMRDEKFNKIPIVRQSMPFGNINKHRLLFIAYSNSVSKFDQMLDQMVGKRNGTDSDATMSFSSCIASNYYYCPSLKELQSIG